MAHTLNKLILKNSCAVESRRQGSNRHKQLTAHHCQTKLKLVLLKFGPKGKYHLIFCMKIENLSLFFRAQAETHGFLSVVIVSHEITDMIPLQSVTTELVQQLDTEQFYARNN